jgi:hypothetical protein
MGKGPTGFKGKPATRIHKKKKSKKTRRKELKKLTSTKLARVKR